MSDFCLAILYNSLSIFSICGIVSFILASAMVNSFLWESTSCAAETVKIRANAKRGAFSVSLFTIGQHADKGEAPYGKCQL